MIEIPNVRKKKLKPRRKFTKRGEKPLYVLEDFKPKTITTASIKCESIDGTLRNARQLAMVWRGVVPRAEIHIRRGHRVVIKTHNPIDTYKALYFYGRFLKRSGR